MGKRIAKEIREEILKRIKEEGAGVAQMCQEYGISDSAIYKWLDSSSKIGNTNPQLELNRLKRENQDLRELVGQLVYEKEKKRKQQEK
jgi:transposase-like protein